MMNDILEKIICSKREEVFRQKEVVSISLLEKLLEEQRAGVSFKQALSESPAGIIAEFKRKSPSKGWIFKDAKIEEIIPAYALSGAASISVLTDELFFGGSLKDLKTARNLVNIPLLRKDFIIDIYQIYQAKAMGADVILLIAAALTVEQTKNFAHQAKELGLETLLEIHSERELDYINEFVDVVGVNNRNLSTFQTDLKISYDLADKIPSGLIKISESGISDPEDVKNLRNAGFNGFLMGENFMKTANPGEALSLFADKIKV